MKLLSILLPMLVAWQTVYSSSSCETSKILAKVGEWQINSVDVSYGIAIEKAYGNEMVVEEAILVSLVNKVLAREVGRMFGLTAMPDEVAALSKYVNKNSKAPEILDRVKRVFGDDRAAYERLYLTPRIISSKLRGWYSRNASIHERERALIEKAHHLARSGKPLEEAAQACGLLFSVVDYGKGNRALPPLLEKYFPQGGNSSSVSITAVLKTLSEGEIYKNIVEDDYGYKVIKLVRNSGSQYTVETITANKHPFMKWFQVQAAKVPVKIVDKELEREIASKYPNVWWVKKWCQQ